MSSLLRQIPAELKTVRSFVLYRKQEEDGEIKKRPYDWLGGKRGNDNPELQLDFENALAKIGSRSDLGLAIFQPSEGIQIPIEGKTAYLHILDLDGFVAEVNGKLQMLELGWAVIDRCLKSYTELSVSMRGAKIFLLSDLAPQTKITIKLPPNEFAARFPTVKKYSESHAVEIFSKGFWNVVTGDRLGDDYSEIQYVPKEQLLDLISYLQTLSPHKELPTELPETAKIYELPNKFGLITALSKIDNQSEDIWNQVAYSLARVLGPNGIDYFAQYARGDYNGKPYKGFSEDAVRKRFARALLEVQKKPEGYGLAHISRLSGLPIAAIRLETQVVATSKPGITAAELSTKSFPTLQWVLDGILPEGSFLLSARPKVGKSWLALAICLGVAYGEPVLGKEVKQGKAIYLALEDTHRRLQSRLRQLRPTGYATENLILHTEWLRFNEGGVEALVKAIEEHKPRIVVIDTLAKVKPPAGRNNGIYESDYAALAPITEVANRYRTTILIVHHNRKGKAETDPLEQISGSLGLAGAVDGALIIDGNRGDPSYTLSLIGRDIPNDDDLAISLQKNGQWVVLGAAKDVFISQERQAMKELLLVHSKGLKPSEVSELTGKKPNAVRKLMAKMAQDGHLINNKGTYSLPTIPSIGGNCGESGGESGDNGIEGNESISGNSGNTSNSVTLNHLEAVTELPQLPHYIGDANN